MVHALYYSWDGQRTEYSVPLCNVQADPESEYVIKYDGSCYEYNKLLSDWKRKVQCPKGQNTFGSEWACDMRFTILGTCPLLGHARLFCNSVSARASVEAASTCSLTFLGQARSGDRPFKILGTCPFLGHALLSSKFLGQDRSWYMPFNILETTPLWRHALQHYWDMPALGTCPSVL